MIVRVVPNVTGLDKRFDYTVPDHLAGAIHHGSVVRVDLHGRRVAGWVVEIDPADAFDGELAAVALVSSRGPNQQLIALAEWAAIRWVGRLRHFLNAASPPKNVRGIPNPMVTGSIIEPRSPASTRLLHDGGGVLRLPPTSDPLPAVLSAAAVGPTLVVVPALNTAEMLAGRLRRSGMSVAVVPRDWAVAAGGADIVIGARIAAWAPCSLMAAGVVIDEHDEALQQQGSPTWHARDVMIERCRRAEIPLLLTSPAPTLTATQWGPLAHPSTDRERRGWPIIDVIDRQATEPWKRSLLTSELIQHLRDKQRRVVVVSNTTGRARLMACRACRQLVRCERCDAALHLNDDDRFVCGRCELVRPKVCRHCQATTIANLRPGIASLQSDIEAAAGREVVMVQGSSDEVPPAAGVYLGTEAALHRVDRADTVAFLDFDRELLAPRYRAAEQAMALLARAARMVGPRQGGGRILIQTFMPDHEVIQAALRADPSGLNAIDHQRRQLLQLPPFGALAELSGRGSDGYVESLPSSSEVVVVGGDDNYVARASDWETLGRHLSRGERPTAARLRIAVDPAR